MNDVGLVNALRKTSGLLAKSDIRSAAATFHHHPFPQLGLAGMLGDDSAVLPAQTGQLLLACEGMHPELVEEDPWFAGWSGVLVNLSDIAAMGGRPLALVNSVWSGHADEMVSLLEGMRFACDRFGVPMVGGHSNQRSSYQALSVAVLGVADGPVLSARAARPGDELWMLVNKAGSRSFIIRSYCKSSIKVADVRLFILFLDTYCFTSHKLFHSVCAIGRASVKLSHMD